MSATTIISFELFQFKPFKKTGIKRLKVNFEELLQILNSTNGTGKSMFLSELNPFPIDKDKFRQSGYKKIEIQAGDETYLFYSDLKRCSCIRLSDETELNQGGTLKAQSLLVEQLLGVNALVWDYITGARKFTKADKKDRQIWMETISGVNYDWAFSLHKMVLKAINDRKGAVRLASKQLATESQNLLAPEIRSQWETELNELTAIHRELLLKTTGGREDVAALARKLESLYLKVNREYKDFYKFVRSEGKNKNVYPDVKDVADLRVKVGEVKNRHSNVLQEIDALTNSLYETNRLRETLKRTDGFTLDSVRSELQDRQNKIDDHLRVINEMRSREDSRLIINPQYLNEERFSLVLDNYSDISEMSSTLISKLDSLNDNGGVLVYPFSRERYFETVSRRDELKANRDRGALKAVQLEEEIRHINHTPDVDCPQCNFKFKPSIKRTEKQVQIDLDIINGKLQQVDKQIQAAQEVMLNWESVDARRTSLANTLLSTEIYRDWLNSKYFGFDNETIATITFKVSMFSEAWANHVVPMALLNKEVTELKKIESELMLVNEFGNESDLHVEEIRINGELAKKRTLAKELNAEIKYITNLGKYVNALTERGESLIASIEEYQKLRKDASTHLNNMLLNELSNEVTYKIGRLSTSLSNDKVVGGAVSSLQTQIDNYTTEVKYLTLLERAINPTTGIIGEQLGEYTRAFAAQLTAIVGKIWGYDLTILPCRSEASKGMDYRFPFTTTEDTNETVPDVSVGSKSQRAVINLGVMLATRAALGLDGMPLFLDEIGEGFDKVHNENLAQFLKQLLTDYKCSNMFLVHHDLLMRSVLGTHQMIVFDASQVVVSDCYNEHVELEY